MTVRDNGIGAKNIITGRRRLMIREKLKILLADDQILFVESLKTFLNNYAEDMTVTGIAVNGKEAVAMAKQDKPDIILMDIRMPEMDGIEAVKAIKPVPLGKRTDNSPQSRIITEPKQNDHHRGQKNQSCKNLIPVIPS
ncbi:MAG: response regulator [Treponema sp.]|jgi:DNA-binding NarL/FixJ family response regulator|nr:response regulator [Treponema sp.]